MSTDPTVEVVKWYTRARKFPQLIGRTPDGAKIPGGPYTITQAVGGGLLLLAGVNTLGWWASYGLLGNALLLLGVTYGAVLLLGRIPVGSRNPLSVASGSIRAASSPSLGKLAGRPVKLPRPRQVRHRIVVLQTTPPEPTPLPEQPRREPAAQPRRPEPHPAPPPALSAVQALLVQAARPPARLVKEI